MELLVNVFVKKHINFTMFSNHDISKWQLTAGLTLRRPNIWTVSN